MRKLPFPVVLGAHDLRTMLGPRLVRLVALLILIPPLLTLFLPRLQGALFFYLAMDLAARIILVSLVWSYMYRLQQPIDKQPLPPPLPPAEEAEAAPNEPAPPRSPASWMEEALAETRRHLGRLEREWVELITIRDRGPVQLQGDAEAREVAGIAGRLARSLEATGEDPLWVRTLRQTADRLTCTSEPAGPRDETAAGISLLGPEKWLDEGHEPTAYLEYLSQALGQMKHKIEALQAQESCPQEIPWRTAAESLLVTVASRRPLPESQDLHGFLAAHDSLLKLLQWEEISVRTGDPIDREIHKIETTRPSRTVAANRVLEVLNPGYRDIRTGEVARKALIVMSEQYLG